ncbi:lipid II flippase MurJ [Gordonia sp. Z-3]|uniref:murein biosynthesis integral membrane protein MurJ n=1 Tax=Gordonia sp. Z-3 TaxID=3115408 RepID=UPI002E285D41|nr:lipid II flippase MurJ [Gordonia sp. Z-3]MED5803091.1 lipid II flippase MurJ [Gordonia sp. Z-3]
MSTLVKEHGVGRTSATASIGTLGSRLLGFVRNWLLVIAIGTGVLGDAYNFANNIPNMIFLLLGGGTIAAVFVPRLVDAYGQSEADGDRYSTFLVLAAVLFGVFATVVVFVCFMVVLRNLVTSESDFGSEATRVFAFWCIPQVFFFAIIAALIQIVNAKGRFAAVSWSYAISSVLVIGASVAIIILSTRWGAASIGDEQWPIAILGAATLSGTALQAVMVWTIARNVGFRFKRFHTIKGLHLRETLRTGAWTVAAAACYQISGLIVAVVALNVGFSGGNQSRGYAALSNAQMILYFAQAIIVANVANVMLQRLSRELSAGRQHESAKLMRLCLIRSTTLLAPVCGVAIVAGPSVVTVVYSFGANSLSSARFIGELVMLLFIGFVPFGLHSILIRPHYAMKNAVPPLWSAIRINLVWIGLSLASAAILPDRYVALGLALSFVAAYSIDLPVKLHGLKGGLVVYEATDRRTVVRVCIALLGGVVVAYGCSAVLSSMTGSGGVSVVSLLIKTLVSTIVFLAVYAAITRRSEGSLIQSVQWLLR